MNKLFFSRLCTLTALSLLSCTYLWSQEVQADETDEWVAKVEPKVIEWRHHIHENPELSNREFETAKLVANHLRSLGIEVQTEVAHTGVVGLLKGGKPGPVVALRADMDALPVTERVDIPYASKVRATYNGVESGVMHACGHDTHVAILMGVAEILAGMKSDLKGTVKFLFQPAEEGAPPGEEGGAELMVKEGVLENPDVDVVFGLHINSMTEVGHIRYKPGGTLAAADRFVIEVEGKQTHGARPWGGVDPIVTSAQIIMGLQTIISRQTELTREAAVISVGFMHSGNRSNIIPEKAKLIGTIRTLNTDMQKLIHQKIEKTATQIAESAGAVAHVTIETGYPVTYNDPALTEKAVEALQEAMGTEYLHLSDAVTGAEDFSFFAQEVPGFFFFIGGRPSTVRVADAAPHHTPDFYVDDEGMKTGIKALLHLTLDYMENPMK
ncbi:MAG: amidohydrolase [Bacteroidota bacterium]